MDPAAAERAVQLEDVVLDESDGRVVRVIWAGHRGECEAAADHVSIDIRGDRAPYSLEFLDDVVCREESSFDRFTPYL